MRRERGEGERERVCGREKGERGGRQHYYDIVCVQSARHCQYSGRRSLSKAIPI